MTKLIDAIRTNDARTENGMPTQINVTMNFRELALLTKDKVKDGM